MARHRYRTFGENLADNRGGVTSLGALCSASFLGWGLADLGVKDHKILIWCNIEPRNLNGCYRLIMQRVDFDS